MTANVADNPNPVPFPADTAAEAEDSLPTPIAAPPREASTPSPNAKKARRQTAFYPVVNSTNKLSKPFSRSAAKRESVLALGSIEHLQHYFTKAGIAAKEKPHSNSVIVPAIGGLQLPSGEVTQILEEDEEKFVLPPSPIRTENPRLTFTSIPKVYEADPEHLKPGVINDLKVVSEAWRINQDGTLNTDDNDTRVDVLGVLRLTTRAIRSVRNYVVSLPDDSLLSNRSQHQYRPSTLKPLLRTRNSNSSLAAAANATAAHSSSGDTAYSTHSQIRRLALDVLSSLHALEETARLPLSDDAYDMQSDHGSVSSVTHSRSVTLSPPLSDGEDVESNTSFSFSVVKLPGREHIRVWSDSDDELLLDSDVAEDGAAEKEKWDERIVLGNGWLYKQDITLGLLESTRKVVAKYLDIVDRSLFGGKEGAAKRGWETVPLKSEKKRGGSVSPDDKRSVSPQGGTGVPLEPEGAPRIHDAGNGGDYIGGGLHALAEEGEEYDEGNESTSTIADTDLPEWARLATWSTKYVHSPLSRAHALIVHLLPASLLHVLPLPSSPTTPVAPSGSMQVIPRIPFLTALSSGQLLCVAYNSAVRKSRKQWGFINTDNVHDVISREARQEEEQVGTAAGGDDEERKVGWTFRRIDNLRLWIAALRLRYLLNIASPQAIASAKPSKNPNDPPPIPFDAKLVARREAGWDQMLENVLLAWVEIIVQERRAG